MQEALPPEWIDTSLEPRANDLGYSDERVDVFIKHDNEMWLVGETDHEYLYGDGVTVQEHR